VGCNIRIIHETDDVSGVRQAMLSHAEVGMGRDDNMRDGLGAVGGEGGDRWRQSETLDGVDGVDGVDGIDQWSK
jgi:hypothetical protein